ncbi:MAG: DUF5606 domain-containing protein [Bacteroidales bacterium]|nr:DUF5606 domain-containing protein [Bacteroidales bacterium]
MLKEILAISGQSGLWKLVSQTKNGIIVENLDSKKRIPAYHTSKVSALEDIAIYTEDKEVPLKDVFKKIYEIENKEEVVMKKDASNDDVKKYFVTILPDYDKDRVYVSDMKKVFVWYNILLKQNLMNFENEVSSEVAETPKTVDAEVATEENNEKPVVAKKPKKTAAPKKAE